MFSDTFAGIAPASVLPFIAAQLCGGIVGVVLIRQLYPHARETAAEVVGAPTARGETR
jgi:arsenate reductase